MCASTDGWKPWYLRVMMGGESHCNSFYRKELQQVKSVCTHVWNMNCLLISLLHPARILMEKFRYSFPSLQDVFCFATIQRHARSSLALSIWATSTLHWEASFLIASRWLLDSQKRELWSTTGTLKERRCDSAQFLLEQRTCWVSKGNLCNIF